MNNLKAETEMRYLVQKNGADVEWVRMNWSDIVRWHENNQPAPTPELGPLVENVQ